MDFDSLNKVGKSVYLPTKPLRDLQPDFNYLVKGAAHVATKFGPRTKVILEDENNEEFEAFLPPRVCKYLYNHSTVFCALKEPNGKTFLRCDQPSMVHFVDLSETSSSSSTKATTL